jgi:hypothetical protein
MDPGFALDLSTLKAEPSSSLHPVADVGCGIRGAKTTEMLICTKI